MVGKRESSLEGRFNTKAATYFFLSIKLVAIARYGFPDRTCFGKKGHIFFVELKKENSKPDVKAKQAYWHRKLRRMGFNVYVCNDINHATEIFEIEKAIQNDK